MSRAPMTRELRERLQGERQYRLLAYDARALSEDTRTVPASLSSETPVRRWFGNEILLHTPEAVDLSRAINGMFPLLFGHEDDELIGAAENFQIKNGRLTGDLRFAENTTRPEVWPQIREGMPLGISIGYSVDEWQESATSDDVTVTRWTLLEVSVVTVPADATVGINRSIEKESPMDNPTAGNSGTQQPDASLVAPANVRLVKSQGISEGVQQERSRVSEIHELFLLPGFQNPEHIELRDMAITGGLSVEQTRMELLKLAGSGVTPIATAPAFQRAQPDGYGESLVVRGSHMSAGKDSREKAYEGMRDAIELRGGMVKDKAKEKNIRATNEFSSMSLVEMARQSLLVQNIDTRGMDPMRIVGTALTAPASFVRSGGGGLGTIGHGAADFANILLDAANKSMMTGWEEAPETYREWVKTISIPDFKTMNMVNRSNFGDLDVVPEFAEYKYGTMSDVKETIALRTYGKLFSITRQAIINDDLGAFTEVPMLMGRAAARMVGDEAYGVLTSNPTMAQDSIALFDVSTHKNYVSTGGAAPSVSTLDAGYAAFGVQTDPSGATLNLAPRYILAPFALRGTLRGLLNSQYDPAGTAGTLKFNPYNDGSLQLIIDSRLDGFNTAGWFLAADPNRIPTVVVGFLNGVDSPFMEQVNSFTQDGVSFKVRLDCRAAAADYRGLYYNDGA